jgi:transcriptional regulator of acetoin/glycerol metabolism
MADDNKQDLLTRMVQRLQEMQPGFSNELALQIEQQLRNEFGGSREYIPRRRLQLPEITPGSGGIARMARTLGVHRSTLYRRLNRGTA